MKKLIVLILIFLSLHVKAQQIIAYDDSTLAIVNGSGNVKGFIKAAVSASAVATELSIPLRTFSGAGSSLTTTGVSAQNTPHFIHLVAVIQCTADGVFGIRFGSEVEGSQAQLNTGSVLIVQEL